MSSVDASLRRLAELEKVAAEVGRSMSQIALNWVAGRPGVVGTVVGATRIEQLEDNLAALDFELPAEMRADLTAFRNWISAGRP